MYLCIIRGNEDKYKSNIVREKEKYHLQFTLYCVNIRVFIFMLRRKCEAWVVLLSFLNVLFCEIDKINGSKISYGGATNDLFLIL